MNVLARFSNRAGQPNCADDKIRNVSRRGFLVGTGSVLVLAATVEAPASLAGAPAAVAPKPGTRVAAFIEINPDGTVKLLSPFVEGGQGINTGIAQIVGEELDLHPSKFLVECAPPGPDYAVVNGLRMTGGSFSTRSSYAVMRKLGATARDMLVRAAAARFGVAPDQLSTDDGKVVHAAAGKSLTYGELAAEALLLEPAETVPLRDPATFRYIRKPIERLDVRAKSTGKATYAIDLRVEGMLYAAVQHAPVLGTEPLSLDNQADVEKMPGVHSVHLIKGGVAVAANSWYRARMAVETLAVKWSEPKPTGVETVAADYSSEGMLAHLKSTEEPGLVAETDGDVAAAVVGAAKVIEADYDAPYLAHGQLEPPSSIARFNADGTLELWTPNQMPELFQAIAGQAAGIPPEKVIIHSPMLGGFFGRHFFYMSSSPFLEAIALAKATGKPVKVLWSREEEFLMDALRPLSFSKFRAAIDKGGNPLAITVKTVGEGPIGRWFSSVFKDPVDPSAVEGIVHKPYLIPNRHMEYVKKLHPVTIAFWRSVGHSMNDFFYEGFLDEIADAAGRDPFEMRRALLKERPRHLKLLNAVADLAGGWNRGPFDGPAGKHARGVSMASPFGSETATIAEVSIVDGRAKVHDLWIAIDPGSIVNPAIVKSQVESAAALGLSAALFEEMPFKDGKRQVSNYDGYQILTRADMPRVHVAIIESGEPMGGIGEPGLPGVAPAVVNAVAALTGQRIRRLPLAKTKLEASAPG